MTKCPACKETRACFVSGQATRAGIRVGIFQCIFCNSRHEEPLNGRSVAEINKPYRDYVRARRQLYRR